MPEALDLTRLEQLAPPPPIALIGRAGVLAHELHASAPSSKRKRLLAAGASALAIVALALTPPGQAVAGWVGDLAGIGDEPTLPQVNSVPGTAEVVKTGSLTDGTPYEVVAKQVKFGADPFVCFGVDFPEDEGKGGGGNCTDRAGTGRNYSDSLETAGIFAPPGAGPGGAGLFLGVIDSGEIKSVQVGVRQDGTTIEIPTDLIEVRGPLQDKVGATYPVTAFAAAIDGPTHNAVERRDAFLVASGFDADGNRIDSVSALARKVPPLANFTSGLAMPLPVRLTGMGGLPLEPPTADNVDDLSGRGPGGEAAQDAAFTMANARLAAGDYATPGTLLVAALDGRLVYVGTFMEPGSQRASFSVVPADSPKEIIEQGTFHLP